MHLIMATDFAGRRYIWPAVAVAWRQNGLVPWHVIAARENVVVREKVDLPGGPLPNQGA
jgi:hypothetical protein